MSDKMGKEAVTSIALTLLEHGIPQGQIAAIVGKSQAWVSNLKRSSTKNIFVHRYLVSSSDFGSIDPWDYDSYEPWTSVSFTPSTHDIDNHWTNVSIAPSALGSSALWTSVSSAPYTNVSIAPSALGSSALWTSVSSAPSALGSSAPWTSVSSAPCTSVSSAPSALGSSAPCTSVSSAPSALGSSAPWNSVSNAPSALVGSVIGAIVCGNLVAASILHNQKERMNLDDNLKRYLQNSINQYNVCELCGVKKEEVEIQVTIRSKKDPQEVIASTVL